MPDLSTKNLSIRAAALVIVYWMVVFALPLMILDPNARPSPLGWGIFVTLIGYCGYSGLTALRRGRKTQIILKIGIPAALFLLGWIFAATIRLAGE